MKYILITGITGAVGSAAAAYFLKASYGVIGVGRKNPENIQHIESLCTDYFQVPVFDDKNCEDLFRKISQKKYPIKAAVFFNGGFDMNSIQNFDFDTFNKLLDQNYLSTVFITKYCIPYFIQQQSGCFIFTSAAATDQPKRFSHTFSYTATKTLINHLALTLRADSALEGIRIALIKPTTIKTEANINAMPDADQNSWIEPQVICERIQQFIDDNNNKFEEIFFDK
ncbi:SDR family oxidoreductase [Gynurincola endophyticus]|uniref:SDR family oxidoreductase n=1 Tax=Gynurincola endophyticus TaxID=2479004 RepID=UPI000F8DCB13|nr:SDR family oxidoreductase [Gynurincola endophyticus]